MDLQTNEKKKYKKIPKCAEIAYILALILLPFGTMLITKADFGVSVVVAPAYICSLKFEFLTFGRAEYMIQGLLLIVFCFVMKKVRWQWLFSFVTALLYGMSLDLFLFMFKHFTPDVLWQRMLCFAIGLVIAAFGIAFFLKAYFPPEVYELFVKGISDKYQFDFSKVKIVYDISSLTISLILSFLFFKTLKGIGIGTIISAFCNGILIGFATKVIERFMVFDAWIKPLGRFFKNSPGGVK